VTRNLIIALVALAVVFWIGLAHWVSRDARRRSGSSIFLGVAAVLGLVPFAGPALYLLFRPAETRDDVRARNVEIAALEAEIGGRRPPACPECSAPVEADYLVCAVCTTRLKVPCAECAAPLDPLWQMCPYCETPVLPELDLDEALAREARAVPEPARATESADV
jgi:Double zinc ribbon